MRSTGQRCWVHAVVVVWGDLPARHVSNNVTFVPGAELVAWLEAQPQTMAASVRDGAYSAVAAMRPAFGVGAPEALPKVA
jgi:hypothetical protein